MWHIWTIDDWEKNIDLTREGHRTGLRLQFDKDIDSEVRRACKEFAVFLRREYFFPIRVVVYRKKMGWQEVMQLIRGFMYNSICVQTRQKLLDI